MPPAIVDELLEQFLIEGRELIQHASDDLLALERTGTDHPSRDHLDGAFRAFHTLKGGAGLFDFPAMGCLLHAAEDRLSMVRSGRAVADRAMITHLIECVGLCDQWIGQIERCGKLPEGAELDSQRLIERLHEGGVVRRDANPALAPPADTGSDLATIGSMLFRERTIRVDTAHVDALLDRVGELTVAKNALATLSSCAAAEPGLVRGLAAIHADIARSVDEVHRAVMRVRMTPLSHMLRRLPRLVREIADRVGKDVRLELLGDAIEADKMTVDALFEPLLHVLRNAVDHGIEPPALRAARGKPAAGQLRVSVRREANLLLIDIGDDGGGIDCEKVRRSAAAQNLLPEAVLQRMDQASICDLIFEPGLTTAATISQLSGRGVGMDAVRSAIEALGGRVGVTSVPGHGAMVAMSLPQSVLIRRIMVVRVGPELYGIPTESVSQAVQVPRSRVSRAGDGEAFVLRGRTIPLLRLARLLALEDDATANVNHRVLVVRHGDHLMGVEVTGFHESLDVVLRPLPGLLAGMPGAVGTALLGDGRVLMILDLPGLIG